MRLYRSGVELLPLFLVGVAMLPGLASAQDEASDTRVEVQNREPYGSYLSDREGRSLYLFEKDAPGSGTSVCVDACTNTWPPYTTNGDPVAGESIDAGQLSTLKREGGNRQVTYGGWPLYYFTGDKQPGDAMGQDVEHLGGEWYLVTPDGKKITHGERSQVPDSEEQPSQEQPPASEGQEVHKQIEDNHGQAGDV